MMVCMSSIHTGQEHIKFETEQAKLQSNGVLGLQGQPGPPACL